MADHPTDQPTNKQTDMRANKELTLPIIFPRHWSEKGCWVYVCVWLRCCELIMFVVSVMDTHNTPLLVYAICNTHLYNIRGNVIQLYKYMYVS